MWRALTADGGRLVTGADMPQSTRVQLPAEDRGVQVLGQRPLYGRDSYCMVARSVLGDDAVEVDKPDEEGTPTAGPLTTFGYDLDGRRYTFPCARRRRRRRAAA